MKPIDEKELERLMEQAWKRLAIVNIILAVVLAIPTLWATHFFKEWSFQIILLYIMLVTVGIAYSPSIINKIWK